MILKRLAVLLTTPLSVLCLSNENSLSRQVAFTLRAGPASNFPVSTRAALVENAKQLDDKIARGERTGSYSPAGWSNRLGTVLTPVATNVYTADRPFYWNRIDVGCRMTVIQLEDGNLWVHSPVGLDKDLKDALAKLGNVEYIVSPNYEHLSFAHEWYRGYPDAFMWGNPGLAERVPTIKWTGEIPAGIRSPDGWTLKDCWNFQEIIPLHVDVEVNPFTGKPFFNEVIFYHTPSKTLLTTDVFWNYPTSDGVPNSHLGGSEWELAPSVESIPIGSKLWKLGMDKVYLPFYKNLMVKEKSKYGEIYKMLLDEWDIETIVPAHGDIIRGSKLVQEVLEDHFKL
eukprot:scaffold982_cov139-Cylindrotheca_fusiformis.AAC.11